MEFLRPRVKIRQREHHEKSSKMDPPGKRKPGRPKGTWRRAIDTEMKNTGYNWNNITRIANNRS